MSKRKLSAIVLASTLLLFPVGCKKKVAVQPPPPPPPVITPPPPPPPPPPKPVIARFTAEPGTVERGQCSTLRWSTENVTDARISPGVGTVSASGNRQVCPSNTTTYELTASGAGGSTSSSATVNVTVPPPPPPPPPPPKKTISERLSTEVQDAFFDYDKSDIREDARATLSRDADALKSILADFTGAVISIEGHCDERGSAEYNLGLGDRRSNAAKDYLVQMGVGADRLKTVSYGKERPQCTDSNESCWQQNRRAHFSAGQ
jgi:peptidoglycan-associated lipoprotein